MAYNLEIQSKFQKITIRPDENDANHHILLCDGMWQLSTRWEHIYHESLVAIPMACAPEIDRVLICGGGDGMSLREALKYKDTVATLVEIDSAMIEIFRDKEEFAKWNDRSMHNERARVMCADAVAYARACRERYDVVVLDFPSPGMGNDDKNYLGMFSPKILQAFLDVMTPTGTIAIQASMPPVTLAGVAEWIVGRGYHLWNYDGYYTKRNHDSFVVASRIGEMIQRRKLPDALKYANPDRIRAVFNSYTKFDKDAILYFRNIAPR